MGLLFAEGTSSSFSSMPVDLVTKIVELPLAQGEDAAARIESTGMILREEDNRIWVDQVVFDSEAQKAGVDFDWEILSVEVENERPPKQLLYIPTLLLLIGMGALQLRRRKQQDV